MTAHPAISAAEHAPAEALGGGLLGRLGSLVVRLAATQDEIRAAQAVRHRVFCEELGARPKGCSAGEAREFDAHDAWCDHVIVLDTALSGPDAARIVATYRLMPQARVMDAGGFYSEQEFTLRSLVARHPEKRFLELGRSCVLAPWRSKRTAELLWQGIWAYALDAGADVLVGCASFQGTVPAAHALPLSWLHHHHRAKGAWRVKALPERFSTMDMMPAEALDMKAALFAMPPLIKGYLRVGAQVGDGCVIDPEFGTTDVFVVLPVANIAQRYIRHYGADAGRFAA